MSMIERKTFAHPAEMIPFIRLNEAKEGRFWHLERTYILKEAEGTISSVRLNLWERLFGSCLGYNWGQNREVIEGNRLDLMIYNLSRKELNTGELWPISKLYDKIIYEEGIEWRGSRDIDMSKFDPELGPPMPRDQWWGKFTRNSQGGSFDERLYHLNIEEKEGLAVDLGCGNSESALYLLEHGWTVHCIDYSSEVLKLMKEKVSEMGKDWLKTEQLQLIHKDIERYNKWPSNVDLIIADYTLPYLDPSWFEIVIENIHRALKPDRYFIGNFFAASRMSPNVAEVNREMGAWFLEDQDEAGKLLSGSYFEVLECQYSERHPHVIQFTGKKLEKP